MKEEEIIKEYREKFPELARPSLKPFSIDSWRPVEDEVLSFWLQKLEEEREELREEIIEILKEPERCARLLQRSLCSYGTSHGDNKTCDCKYAWDRERQVYKSEIPRLRYMGNVHIREASNLEECGCCEARNIIRAIEIIKKDNGGERK